MKNLIVNVQDKTLVERLKSFCNVIYESKFINIVGIEIKEDDISMLDKDANVISYHESETGKYQPA